MMITLKFHNRVAAITLSMLGMSIVPKAGADATLVINEFMADNGSTVADPQGHYDDWVEIYNYGAGTVDLGGMYLTDDLTNPTKWQFPAGTMLGPDSYLLVWADEDVLDNPNGLHAGFKLSAGGEEVALFSTNGTTLVDSISFGTQTEDVSYGRFPNGGSTWYFMDDPTPNAANATAQSEEVYFSRLGGIMTSSFTLKLSTPSDTGAIRYTTDGSEPTVSSTLYNDASGISINNSQSRRIRARAFQSGLAPGPVRTEAWLAASPALAAFDSNLPIMVFESFGDTIPDNPTLSPKPLEDVYATVIDTNEVSGRAFITDQPDFAGRTGMRIRGSSAAQLPKKPYKVETWNEDDSDLRVALLGFPSDSDWVLHNPYTDKTFMRNVLAYKLSNDMGYYSTRTKFVEVFVNEDGGQIGGPASGDYMGVYVLMEQIKRGKDRVDIEELRPSDNAEPEISGGYIIKNDKNPEGAETFPTLAGDYTYVEPDLFSITAAQKSYIQNYIDDFETVHQSAGFDDPVTGYAQYIDVESFIIHDFNSEITREADTYNFSTYATKDRGGKLMMAPHWDYNLSMGNNEYSVFDANIHVTSGWHRDSDGWSPTGYYWHKRLLDDPEYLLKYADRWHHLRETVLSDSAIEQTLDSNRVLLDAEAAGRNYSRWDILNTKVTFPWSGDGPTFYYGGNPKIPCNGSDHTYWMQVEWMKNWLTGNGTPSGTCAAEAYAPQYADRLGWLDENMDNRTGAAPPPSLFINGSPADTGGPISLPDTLTMSGGPGTIYYTLDGSDPREAFTGNALGTAYSASGTTSILLDAGAGCTARIPTGPGDASGWTNPGFNDAGWLSGTTGVGFEASPGTYDYTSLIGLNVSAMQGVNPGVYVRVPFSVSGATAISELKLKMKYDDAFVAYLNGTQVFSSAYAPASPAWNSSATTFNDDANAVVYEEFDISAYIDELQEGDNLLAIHGMNVSSGSSDLLLVPRLEATSASGSGLLLNKTVDVRARIKNGSSWSALNRGVFADNRPLNDLRITELMYHPEIPGAEYIELKNIGADTISLYLCQFTDGIDFTFPDVTLNPGQHVLVVETQAVFEAVYGTGHNIAGEFAAGSALNNGGEEIVLRDAAGREIHDFDYNDWYPATDGRGASLCIIDPAATNLNLWDEKTGWQASANAGNPGADSPANVVANGAIVINEILTHTDEADGDWIELHNTTGSPIDIGGWFLSDSRDNLRKYQIAAGTSIAPGGYVVFTQTANFGLTASDPGKLTGFGLSELGEAVFLSSGSGTNLAGGYSISEDFGAATREVTLGRHNKSALSGYGKDFVAMETSTMGAANSGPLVPDVVISEIMYNPSQNPDETGEFIELFNRTPFTVDLFDPAHPSNTWKFTQGIDYTFPTGVSIPPGSHILVVRTDPDIFREVHGIPASRGVYGPYSGALGNDGEKIELSMPGDPEPSFVPYIRTEKVNYSDGTHPVGGDPWPAGADGTGGYSLQRNASDEYGNDVANWRAAAATPVSPDVKFIELHQTESGLSLQWTVDGVLKSTIGLDGPWTNEAGATSPYPIATDQPHKFFRLD
jgi:hypothetical protein